MIYIEKRPDYSEERRDSFPNLVNGKEYPPKGHEDSSSTVTARRIETSSSKPGKIKLKKNYKYDIGLKNIYYFSIL